jgi:hypothetical protein
MTTRHLGSDYRLYVSDGAGGYNLAALVQSDLTMPSPQDLIDQSGKGDVYKVKTPGRPDRTITCTGVQVYPDTNGLERVYSLFKAVPQAPVTFQVRNSPFSSGDVVFEASMFISNFSRTAPDQQNATFSFELSLAAAPTVDLLD